MSQWNLVNIDLNVKSVICQYIWATDNFSISCEIVLRWMLLDFTTEGKSAFNGSGNGSLPQSKKLLLEPMFT